MGPAGRGIRLTWKYWWKDHQQELKADSIIDVKGLVVTQGVHRFPQLLRT